MAMFRKELGVYEVLEDIEALPAFGDLQLLSQLGISHLILEGDFLAVVEPIHTTRGEGFIKFKPIDSRDQTTTLYFSLF